MRIELPIYRWFCYGYPNSSSDEGHLGWLFIFGFPWFHHGWFSQHTLGHIYLHHEGLSVVFKRLSFAFVHRGGYNAKGLKPWFKFESYGFYVSRNPQP